MAVKVFPGKGNASHDYDKGQTATINAGHLMVTGADLGDVIAVYAPGSWDRAKVV